MKVEYESDTVRWKFELVECASFISDYGLNTELQHLTFKEYKFLWFKRVKSYWKTVATHTEIDLNKYSSVKVLEDECKRITLNYLKSERERDTKINNLKNEYNYVEGTHNAEFEDS